MRLVWICAMYGFLGMGIETFLTAMELAWKSRKSKPSRRQLNGYSSAWYFPLYSTTPLLLLGSRYLGLPAHSWVVRGLTYTVIIFIVEYIGMAFLKWLNGTSPPEKSYLRSAWNIHGLINLSLAPVWFTVSLAFEHLFLLIKM